MYLLTIFPLTYIPRPASQALSYFCWQSLPAGGLVSIPLKKRKIIGVVINSQPADKLAIKSATFKLKGIDKILVPKKIFESWQIELAEYLGGYYWTSPGLFFKMMIAKIQKSDFRCQKSERKNKQTLILVPEISQIEQTIKELKLKDYTILHSGLPKKQLLTNWSKIREGVVKNIIGTRGAVFAPFNKLEKILILDESNPHHKSWEMAPHYRVHEVAKKLSELHGAKLIFEAKVPSVETSYLVKKEGSSKINLVLSKQPRPLARTKIVDMREELKTGNFSIFSRSLQNELEEIIKNKGQAILFINRRGAGTFVLCRDCGYVAQCPNCDVPLVQHLFKKNSDSRLAISDWQLICHHCGHSEKPPGICPQCRSIRIKAFGAGTQKVELELKKIFPQTNVVRLDIDTASTSEKQKEIIKKFTKKESNILVATQMIFSYFPCQYNNETMKQLNNVGLVGLVSADTLLHLPDFRSGERTFQTIVKLKNMVRQAHHKSVFIIQSYNPGNCAIEYAAQNNWQKFYQTEIKSRAELDYPPFSQIIKLRFAHQNPQKAQEEAKVLAAKLTRQIKNFSASGGPAIGWQLLGPSPAFIPKVKGKYAWQLLIKDKLPKSNKKKWLANRNKALAVVPSNWQVDVDPETIL